MMNGVPFALGLCLLGLIVFALDDDPPAKIVFARWVLVAAGTGWIVFALFRRSHPGKPRFVLSPTGILYRISRVKEVLVPRREVQDVDTIDIVTKNWAARYSSITPKLRFHDVTVILVSKQFYDASIFIDSFFLRGAGWGICFIPKGSSVQIALHHEPVSVESWALREAVEARWQAFRDQPAGSSSPAAEAGKSVKPTGASVPTVMAASRTTIGRSDPAARPSPTPGIVAGRDNLRAMSAWEAVKIVVPLIGIAVVLANLLGLWATPGQTAAREERKKWAAAKRQWEEQQRQFREEQREKDKRLDDAFRSF